MGDFLRRHRESLEPGQVGVTAGSRRRTPGLRREEVAALAHMSVDFYTRLEQARGSRPSRQTVAALASALRLNRDERDHLYELSGHTPPPLRLRSEQPSAGLLRIMRSLETPAQIVSDIGVTLAQNRLARLLLGDQSGTSGLERSMIYRWFTDPHARAIHPEAEHATHSHSYVAMLRAAHSRNPTDPTDPEVEQIIGALLDRSREFRALWQLHEVGTPDGTTKRFISPIVGTLTLDCQILTAQNQSESLVVLTAAPGSEDEQLLKLLAVVGDETFA